MSRLRYATLMCCVGSLALVACGGPVEEPDAAIVETPDAGGLDGGPRPPDAGRDSGPVVMPDAFMDPMTDAFMDPGTDAFMPLDPDAGPPAPRCGDGAVDSGETCDDGNEANDDGCDSTCAPEAGWTCDGGDPTTCDEDCGDGVLVGDEAGPTGCDDGGTADGDGCDATCEVESGFSCAGEPSVCSGGCGDGMVTGTELCDDGGMADGDGCSSACATEPGYECSGSPSTCATRCGDGVTAGTERCDDGGTAAGDGCSVTCAVESGFTCTGAPSTCATRCGDMITAGTEACDDGNTVTETCPYGTRTCTVCTATCTSAAGATSLCGDSRVDAAEETCDDGNNTSETACAYGTATCTGCDATCDTTLSLTGPTCGDGAITAGSESCDDGGTATGDGCSASCEIDSGYRCTGTPSVCTTVCGDSITAGAETCDDGNTNTEPCAYGLASCMVCGSMCTMVAGTPSNCGDGIVNGTERCDDGNGTVGDGCEGCFVQRGWTCSTFMGLSSCATTCGDGITITPAETCDDGWLVGGRANASADGCDTACQYEGPPWICTPPSVEPTTCTLPRTFTASYTGAPVTVSTSGTSTVFATVSGVTGTCTIDEITEVSVRIGHSWVGDVTMTLFRPDGTSVRLIGRPNLNPPGTCCGSSSDLAGVYVFRDDAAAPFPENPGSPVPNGPWRAADDVGAALSMTAALAGGSAVGDWRLEVSDGADGDGGSFDTITVTGECL